MGKIKAFFSKIKNLSPAAKASFWFVVSNIALKGISFITTPIFTRLMEVEDYGATSVFVTWEGVISIFATLSLAGGVYNVAQTKYGDDINAFTSSMLSLTFVASLLVYSVCILVNTFVPSIFELSNTFLIFMWVQTFTNACISFWLMRKRFLYNYKSVIAYTFVNALLSPTIAIVAILIFPNHAAYAKVIGAGVVGIVIGIVICISTYVKGKKVFSGKYWKYALKFNLPLLPHYLSSTVLNSSDKLMINSMVSSAHAGIYAVAHSITGLIGIITQSINYSLIPYTMQSIKEKKFKGLRTATTGCSVLVAVICICVMMFAKEGILIFATSEYLEAVWFIPPLTLSVLFHFISGIVGNIMFYYEKTWHMSLITMICAALNLGLNYVGIIKFGYIATGYTTLICSFVQLLLYYFVVRKFEKNLNQIVDLRWFFAIVIVYAGFMAYSMLLHDVLWARIGLLALVVALVIIFHKKIIKLFKSMKKNKTPVVATETAGDDAEGNTKEKVGE